MCQRITLSDPHAPHDHHATGGLPDSLDALVPLSLDRVPRDGYDGREIRYSKPSRVVYALGDDLARCRAPEHPSQTDADAPGVAVLF